MTADLHVHQTLTFPDGTTHTSEWDQPDAWSGHTASGAADARHRNLKNAGRDVSRTGDALTVTADRGDVVETQILTFTDGPS